MCPALTLFAKGRDKRDVGILGANNLALLKNIYRRMHFEKYCFGNVNIYAFGLCSEAYCSFAA
jgi:hypothetical protein